MYGRAVKLSLELGFRQGVDIGHGPGTLQGHLAGLQGEFVAQLPAVVEGAGGCKPAIDGQGRFIYAALDKLEMPYIRSQANFLMIEIGAGHTADEIAEKLLMQGVIVRAMTAYGYPQHLRVTVGRREENIRFLEAIKQVI